MAKSVMEIKIAWWFIYLYLPLLVMTTRFCQMYINIEVQPDWDKVRNVLHKAIKLRLK